MILLYLKGGIGNQLFEYAAGRSLSLHLNTNFKIDKSYYDQKHYEREGKLNDFYHIPSFRDILTAFNITAPDASDREINQFHQHFVSKVADRLKPNHLRKKYIQPHIGFDPNFFRIKGDTLIKGFFQSEKYFLAYADEVRKELSFKEDIRLRNRTISEKINACNSISVHIRRGDYVHHAVASAVLGALGEKYYGDAKIFLENKLQKSLTYFVFSDDLDWVRTNLTMYENVHFIDKNDAMSDVDELYLMSQCKHNIIANSSFSWWGAWLNDNPDKIVIAPKKWFNNAPKGTQDIVPEAWLRI